MRALCLLLCLLPSAVSGEILVAAHTIRSQTILQPQDLNLIEGVVAGALTHPGQAIGLETRVVLYAGRPVHPKDIAPPAVIERNQIVTLHYSSHGLKISTEARALSRAAAGETLRVINLSSRSTVFGTATEAGNVLVGNPFKP